MSTGILKVSMSVFPELQASKTSSVWLSSLPEDQKMIIYKIVWIEMFDKISDESFKGFDEVEVGLNSIIEENDGNKEQEIRTCQEEPETRS